MTSYNPSAVSFMLDHNRDWSESSQENTHEKQDPPTCLLVDPTLLKQDSTEIETPSRSLGHGIAGPFDESHPPQTNPIHYPSPSSSGCPFVPSAMTISIGHPGTIEARAYSVGSLCIEENSALPKEGRSLDMSLSPSSCPPCESSIDSATRTRKRVFLRSDKEKAQLVGFCIANFGDYVCGKERFWARISFLYRNLHPEGAVPNVKGYMQRYGVQRKRELEEAVGLSGIAESATEWQQSMDHWLELVRDFDHQLKEEKNKTTDENALRKKEVTVLRENMTQSFMRKRGLPETTSSIAKAGDERNSLLETYTGDSKGVSSDSVLNKKPQLESTGSEPGRDRVFTSQRRTIDRILNTLNEGYQEMVKQMQEIEREKMQNWKELLRGAN